MGLFKKAEPEKIMLNATEELLRCVVCGHGQFTARQAQLNTALATFLRFDWANRTADCLVCARCRYIHWFLT